MRKKKIVVFLLAVAVLFSGITGCGKEENDGIPSETAEKVRDDRIVVTIASNAVPISSLDKFDNVGSGSDDTGYLWGDPLVSNDHKGNYSPALATEWGMSEDALSFTFQLRKGVLFHNGEELTSKDVKVTYERLLKKDLNYTNSWYALDRVETPDDYTAVIYLSEPMPTFYDEVGFVPIICASAYLEAEDDFFLKPVGTGAYYVESFDPETGEGHFVRNESWWSANEGNADEIVYRFMSEDMKRGAALQDGAVDIINMLPPEYYDSLDQNYMLTDIVMDAGVNMGFNCGPGKVFESYELRAALSMCIDRNMLCNSIIGGGQVAVWPVGENTLGYVDGYEYEYDPNKAKGLVEASDYDGREINLIYFSAGFQRADEIAQTIQSRALEIGLEIILEPMNNREFEERRSNGKYDITLSLFSPTCGDPQTEVAVIMANDVFHTGYQNDSLKELCREVQEITNKKERVEKLEEIFRIEMEELAPFVYLYSPISAYATTDKISNIRFYNDYSADYRFVVKTE